ncbi:uncharacterized protein BCR38DRAFT_334393 [Pseudomassariella vexata]|uniref:Extracellular serine-rich protein n=1 Tax=Pseudomassariella vexata TaxID=1141098 RepID=A0A1Y2EDF4_9PEZI|nr:uncharacterized protein BCR38DRAFT_334393 [Pseudomassariella vexata]ORY69613.1 hypothetical protein BCR38DRAFT_334393 [Pseudomassariella vexata]
MFTTKTFTTLLFAAGVISAAPTSTSTSHPSRTVSLTGVTHSVVAGLAGLRFDPENVVASAGDIIEWHFLPKNHSIAQSSFAEPCQPLANSPSTSFFSGFNFATSEGQAPDVFQIVVEDASKPIWYYCAQQTGAHCQNGMVGVINQNFESAEATLAKHKELAAKTGTSVIPPAVQGGEVIENPNPLGGFKL